MFNSSNQCLEKKKKKHWYLIQAFTAGKTSSPFLPMVCVYLLPLQKVICFLMTLTLINPAPTLSLFFQFTLVTQSCPTLCDPMNHSTPGPPVHHKPWSLLKLMPIELVMPSSHLILCCPLLLLPPTPPSIRVFSNESTLHMRWPKYWSFSFSISPSNEHPGLISFRMDWLDLLAVQGTLKSLPQHHSSKASIFWHSALFTVQLSQPYMTTGKTIALTRQTFVGKVMSLLFNMLSRLVLNFLPSSKHLLISWLQSPSAVILEPQNIKSDTVSTVSPSISHEVMGPDAMILVFWRLSFKTTFSLSHFHQEAF